MATAAADRIEKSTLLHAPRSRAWRAIANAEEFGKWFGVRLAGPFAAGQRVTGRITHPGFEHVPFELTVERIEPETLLSFRWHPFAIDPKVDYSKEPTTLVEFRLADAEGGTQLTLVESGFDRIPAQRRDEAFRQNGAGWETQLANIARHVAG